MRRPHDVEVGGKERLWGAALRDRTGEGCSSGADLVAFVEGRLGSADRQRVIQHLGHCSGCRGVVLELREAERAVHAGPRAWFANRFLLAGTAAAFVLVGFGVWATLSPSGKPGVVPGHAVVASKVGEHSSVVATSVGPVVKAPSVVKKAPASASHPNSVVAMNDGHGTSEVGVRAMKMVLLLGANHVYKLPSKDSHLAERKKIEEKYADQVAAKKDACSQAIAQGADPDLTDTQLKTDLNQLSDERDAQLGELYPVADDMRADHPELNVDGNGPYQVVEVDYHQQDQVPVIDEYVVVKPWPEYAAEDVPYGWTYGQRYQPTDFHRTYVSWHDTHIGEGRPVFYGLHGHAGPVKVAEITRSSHGRYAFRASSSSAVRGSFGAPVTRYSNSPQMGTRYTPQAPAPSRYSHSLEGLPTPQGSVSGSKFGQPSSGSRYSNRLGSSFGNSARGDGVSKYGSAGSISRYGGVRPSVGESKYGAPSGGSRYGSTHAPAAGGSRYSGSGSFGRASGSAPRSSGFGGAARRPAGSSGRSRPSGGGGTRRGGRG